MSTGQTSLPLSGITPERAVTIVSIAVTEAFDYAAGRFRVAPGAHNYGELEAAMLAYQLWAQGTAESKQELAVLIINEPIATWVDRLHNVAKHRLAKAMGHHVDPDAATVNKLVKAGARRTK